VAIPSAWIGFLIALKSPKKFKAIVERDGYLSGRIDSLKRFPPEYIASLKNKRFARTCEDIVAIPSAWIGFLIALKSPKKFKAIVESDYLLGRIYILKIILESFYPEYIAALEDNQFARTCENIVTMTMTGEWIDFLRALKSPIRFKTIVESEQLFGRIDALMRFPPEHIVALTHNQLLELVQGSQQ
jgi:hypothetical protein